MLALLRASQALSSETSLARLQGRVAEQLGAMTGATQVQMMLPSDGSGAWHLLEVGETEAPQRSVEQAGADGLLPLSVLRYVERTRALPCSTTPCATTALPTIPIFPA